jgi:ABC-type transporter Mla subunit MlaD
MISEPELIWMQRRAIALIAAVDRLSVHNAKPTDTLDSREQAIDNLLDAVHAVSDDVDALAEDLRRQDPRRLPAPIPRTAASGAPL